MKYEDIDLLLSANAAMERAEVDGRTVVNRMKSLSPGSPIVAWTGDDRPEFHKTLDGVNQVCVERGTTNLVGTESRNTNDWTIVDSGWNVHTGAAMQTEMDDYIQINSARISLASQNNSRIETGTGSQLLVVGNDAYVTLSVYIKRISGNTAIRLGIGEFADGSFSGQQFDTIDITDDWQRYVATFQVGNTTDGINFRLRERDAEASEFLIDLVQCEIGRYPTLFTPGTRPAPIPVIDTISTEKGTIGVAVDLVIGDVSHQRYSILGSSPADWFLATRAGNRLQIRISGNIPVQVEDLGHSWQPDHTRKKWAFIISWDRGELYYSVLDPETKSVYVNQALSDASGYSGEEIIDLSLSRNHLEGRTSMRYENYMRFSERVTPQNAKALMEKLTTGTSMQTAAQDMVMV